jgi:hypothetical protein
VTHKGIQPAAVTAALMRDLFGVLEREGVVLITVALPEHKQLMRAMGFERLPVEYPQIWGSEFPTEAYMLDLQRIGLEAWIEAIMAGRRPPRVLAADELERAVQDVLTHWQDDAWLTESTLANSAAIARSARGRHQVPSEAVRCAIREALKRAADGAPPEMELACRATESAYLARAGSHERTAEELAVSRTTFYRLLRRGVRAIAQALAAA